MQMWLLALKSLWKHKNEKITIFIFNINEWHPLLVPLSKPCSIHYQIMPQRGKNTHVKV